MSRRPVGNDRLAELRAQISEIDRSLFALVNRRLGVVAELKAHKEEHGIGFVDPQREQAIVDERVRENDGPLSEGGLRGLYAELLALMKRELG
jgi:chorismate mutase